MIVRALTLIFMEGRELTIARLHRPDAYQEGEMLFTDVWIHRLVQRGVEQNYQACRMKGVWNAETTQDPAEDTMEIVLPQATRVMLIMGIVATCYLGVQKCSSSVAVMQKQDLAWRVRQIFSCFDVENYGMAKLNDLKEIDDEFFGEPEPAYGLNTDDEGMVTSNQLVAWFEGEVERFGEPGVEEVVSHFEDVLAHRGHPRSAPSTITLMESAHSKCIATCEGVLPAGTYLLMSRCSLSEQGALEKAGGGDGEPYFLWVMGDHSFEVQGRSALNLHLNFRAISMFEGLF